MSSTAYHQGYSYSNPYYIDKRPSHPPPPPLPPKELEYNITKETHHDFAELEGDSSDIGRLSLDDKSPTSSRAGTERLRKKDKRKEKGAKPAKIATPARTRRKLRILSLGTLH